MEGQRLRNGASVAVQEDVEIIVASCQKYSDAWAPFVSLFRRFWPDCKYPLTLVTDVLDQRWHGDRVIPIGTDTSWCQNLFYGLADVRSDLVLLMQEDFFLNDQVDVPVVERAVELMKSREVSCVRLMPCPGPDREYDNLFGYIADEAPYRVSCQAAIWRREALMEILHGKLGPAEFEINGTAQRPTGTYMSVRRDRKFPLPYLVSAISRGLWNPDAVRLCKKYKINIDLSRRPVEGEAR